MTQAVLHLFAQFGEGLFVTLGNKQRIVTKPTRPSRREFDAAFASAFEKFSLELKFIGVTNR